MEFKNLEKKYWDLFYGDSGFEYSPNRDLPFHDNFKNILKDLPRGSNVLEIACGVRCDGIEIAQKGITVYETDISDTAVEKARQIYKKLNIENNGKFISCDAENMPFENNFFDASFIAASFHHLPNPILALREMKRVTKNGGFIILGVEPNAWPYFTIFLLLKPLKKIIRAKNNKKFSSIADDTTDGFTKKKLKFICQEAGLKIIFIKRVKYISEFYDSGLRLISRLIKKNIKPNRQIQIILSYLDNLISYIPIINLFNWHWNVVCIKE